MTYPHIHVSNEYPDMRKISETYPHIHISNGYPLDIQDLSSYPHIQCICRYEEDIQTFIHISTYPMDIHLDISWIRGYMDIQMDISWISHGYLMDNLVWISILFFWISRPRKRNRISMYPCIHDTYP